jgi:hypothetical protein
MIHKERKKRLYELVMEYGRAENKLGWFDGYNDPEEWIKMVGRVRKLAEKVEEEIDKL